MIEEEFHFSFESVVTTYLRASLVFLFFIFSVDVSEEHLEDEGVVPVVEINFEYVRKDRRQRRYFMEDQSSSEVRHAWYLNCYLSLS